MELSEFELDFCIDFTNKLMKHPLAYLFLSPVDPIRDGVPDYFSKITKPMDLGTVLDNLENGKYKNSEDWKSDVLQIWKNAQIYNSKNPFIYEMASILNRKCLKHFKQIPKTKFDIWKNQVSKLNNQILGLISLLPNQKNLISIDTSNKLSS